MIPKGDEVRGSSSRVTALDDREIHVGLEDFVQVIRPDIEGDMLNDLDDLGVTATRRQAPFLDPTRSNKNKEGAAESVVLLCRVLPQVETHLASRPRAFGADDLLDAAAAAWSALRLHNAEVLPVCTPERDGKDLSVAIWY